MNWQNKSHCAKRKSLCSCNGRDGSFENGPLPQNRELNSMKSRRSRFISDFWSITTWYQQRLHVAGWTWSQNAWKVPSQNCAIWIFASRLGAKGGNLLICCEVRPCEEIRRPQSHQIIRHGFTAELLTHLVYPSFQIIDHMCSSSPLDQSRKPLFKARWGTQWLLFSVFWTNKVEIIQ